MPVARLLGLTRLREPLLRIFAHRLEQPVAFALGLDYDERLIGELRDLLEHVRLVNIAESAYGLRRLQRPATREYGEAPEHRALFFRQQVVTPVDQRAQRLLARQHGAVASGKEAEAVVESRSNGLYRKRAHPRGGELDGERD